MFLNKTIFICMLLVTTQCAPMNKKQCQEFLKTYGYVRNDIEKNDDFEKSLKDFQGWFSLPTTGKLDNETVQQMERPRCGHPDKKTLEFTEDKWSKHKLTYKFKSFPLNEISRDTLKNEFQKAFKFWTDHTPLEFTEDRETADIEITFYSEGDGPGKTLAYAYFPQIGDIFLDNEDWTIGSGNGFNLLMVAAHEIGHSLGLEHSSNKDTLMYPYVHPYDPNFKLHSEDISRIQNLYGKKEVMSLCEADSIDTAFYEKSAAFIVKDKYIWKFKNGKMDSDYPKEISEKWKGGPSALNAIYNYNNIKYLHEGKNIWKYDGEMKKIRNDKKIVSYIDDGVTYENRTYIFKGSNYYRYDNLVKQSGYPKPISSYWSGIPNSIDAVYYEDKYPFKYFYFFKGNRVYKFNMDNRIMLKEMSLQEYLSC